MKLNIHLIGLGGTGGWVWQALLHMPIQGHITLHDQDTIERRNLDRQLFGPEDIGKNKADATLARSALPPGITASTMPLWFHDGTPVEPGCLLFCCADNHRARLACLDQADAMPCHALICGNEYVSADAYYYNTTMRETASDPRVFAPEILTDRSGDPNHPVGCTGVMQEAHPQLSIANMASAAMAMRLFWWWFMEQDKPDDTQWWPVRHGSAAIKQWTIRANGEMR